MKKSLIFATILTYLSSEGILTASVKMEEVGSTIKTEADSTISSTLAMPQIVANALSFSEEFRQSELFHLKKALERLLASDYEGALSHFKEAIGYNGSPLGYFYLAALSNDERTSERYFNIVKAAVKSSAISKSVICQHLVFFDSLNESRAL